MYINVYNTIIACILRLDIHDKQRKTSLKIIIKKTHIKAYEYKNICIKKLQIVT